VSAHGGVVEVGFDRGRVTFFINVRRSRVSSVYFASRLVD
jgi:hypothetical protein